MPRVPGYDSFQATPSASPVGNFQPGVSAAQAAIPGEQMKAMGQGIQQGAGEFGGIIADAQAQANALRVDDAMNKAKETAMRLQYDPKEGFTNLKGINALERPDGQPLAEEYGGKLQENISSIAEGLGNDAQRQAFQVNANKLLTQFKGSAMVHEGSQFNEYGVSVRDGTIANRTNEIGINYQDPNVVAQSVESIRAATYDKAQLLGKSAEWSEAASRDAVSGAHKTAILAALQDKNATYADQYMKAHTTEMNAKDILEVNGHLTKELDSQIGQGTAAAVVQEAAPKMKTSDTDRAFNIALGSESRKTHFGGPGSVGGPNDPTLSPAGAVGEAQVMPKTAPDAAKLAGVPWDPELFNRKRTGDPVKDQEAADYNRKLGKAYFDQQLSEFGNLPMAYAAYNGGPQRLRDAIAAAKNDRPLVEVKNADGSFSNVPDDKAPVNWQAHMPKETQDYVDKNMKAYNTGDGQYQKPTLYELQQKVREKIGTEHPERLKIALDETARQYDGLTKSIKDEYDQAKTDAMRKILENGGSYSDLPNDVRARLDPNDVGAVMDFGKKISSGDNTTNMWLYNKLVSQPDQLTKLSDDQFFQLRKDLSEEDFKFFSKERAARLNGTGPNDPGSIGNDSLNNIVNNRLKMGGIDPTPKDGSDDAAKVGSMRKFINDTVIQQQMAAGKKFDDAQLNKAVDQIFATTAPGTSFWSSNKQMPLLTMTVSNIPSSTRSAIKTVFKNNGISDPSDSDILSVYWKMTTSPKKTPSKTSN